MQLCSASWLQSIMTSAHVPETMSGGKSVGGGDCMASQGMSPCTQMYTRTRDHEVLDLEACKQLSRK